MLTLPFGTALVTLLISLTILVFYWSDSCQLKKRQNCTRKGTAVLTRGKPIMVNGSGQETRKIRFTACDSKEYEVCLSSKFVDSHYFLCKTGEQVPICYDPEDPTLVIIGEDPSLGNKLFKSQKICKVAAAVALVAGCALLALLFL